MAPLPTVFDARRVLPCAQTSTGETPSRTDHLVATRYRFVPTEMQDTPCWMVARSKVPHRVTRDETGRASVVGPVDVHDPANHSSFTDAVEAIAADAELNLMFALGIGNDFACVDLDDPEKAQPEHQRGCRDYQEALRSRLSPMTYSEVSLSGAGAHFVGRCPTLPTEKATTKHAEWKVDLLFRSALVLTGDHREGTRRVGDISGEMKSLHAHMTDAKMMSGTEGQNLPVDTTVTPANCSEKRLVSILSSDDFKHGRAFRTGHGLTSDWSFVRTAILNAAAEFCTDEVLVRRVLYRSGFVQLAEAEGRETKAEKFDRQWSSEWSKALAKTESARRARVSPAELKEPLSLEHLWEQNAYVQYMVQERAKRMITEGLVTGTAPVDLAPLFRYLKPETVNRLEDDLRRSRNEMLARACMEARIALEAEADAEVQELNSYLNRVVAEEKRINLKARFRELNASYYIVENYGGTAKVFRDAFHPETGAQEMWAVRAFCEAKAGEKAFVAWDLQANAPVIQSAASLWVTSESARRYARHEARFETTDAEIMTDTGRVYNLFRGWATAPVAGDWPAIRYLIHEILCCGIPDASEYLLNYLAQMVQFPHVLPGTAIILQSEEQGTGKTTFMGILRSLLGARYCSSTADANTLVGQFNAQAMNKILLHFEEAVAPNDRVLESRLKALITNETLTYNPKGLAAIEARNYARVVMTSNARQVAHLARHDRRMFVLNVSAKHANETGFWQPAHRAFSTELEAFMHHLWTRDISAFRPGAIPQTGAKDVQKMESVVGVERVLRDFLEAGRLPACSHSDGRQWLVRVSALSEHFVRNGIRVGNGHPQPGKVFEIVALSPVRVQRMSVSGQESKSYRVIPLPSLAEARAAFLAHQNVAAHNWGDDPGTDWTLG